MKKCFILAAILFIGVQGTLAAFADTPKIVGDYTCRGTNFIDQKQYESKLSITQSNQTYQFSWKSSDGRYKGTGFFADDATSLVVAFEKVQGSKFNGAQLYKVSADGTTFHGKWIILGKGLIGSEECQRK